MANQTETLLIIAKFKDELSTAMAAVGVKSVKELKKLAAGLKAVDSLQRRAAKSAKKTGLVMASAWRKAAKGLLGFTRAFLPMFAAITSAQAAGAALSSIFRRLGTAMRVSVVSAAAFGIAMGEISTILPNAAEQMVGLERKVKDLSVEMNKPALDVAKGLYQAISAGFSDADDAMVLLTQAARLGTAGLADTADTIDLLTTAVNAFRREVTDAESISDVFFETVRLGKTTITELASTVGKALPLAASLGISIEEVSAAMATLTQEGFNTGEAMTAVRALFKALLRQVGQLNLVFNKTGEEYTLQTVRANGLANTLEILRQSVTDDSEAMLVLGGRVEAAGALFGLTGKNLSSFQRILKGVRNSAGATQVAFQKMLDVDSFFLEQAFNTLKVEQLSFGDAIIEGAAKSLRAYGGIEEVQKRLKATFEGSADVISRVTEKLADWVLSFTDVTTSAELMALRVEDSFNTIERRLGSFFSVFFDSKLEDVEDRIEELKEVVQGSGVGLTSPFDFTPGDISQFDSPRLNELAAQLELLGVERDLAVSLDARKVKFDESLSVIKLMKDEAARLLQIDEKYLSVLQSQGEALKVRANETSDARKEAEIAAAKDAQLFSELITDFDGDVGAARAFFESLTPIAEEAAETTGEAFRRVFDEAIASKDVGSFLNTTAGKGILKFLDLLASSQAKAAGDDIKARLRVLREGVALENLLFDIRSKQNLQGGELLANAKARLAVSIAAVQSQIDKKGSLLSPDAIIPATAELERVFFDNLRDVDFEAILELGGPHETKIHYDENPEEFRRVIALLPDDFKVTFVPTIDRSAIDEDIANLRSGTGLSISEQVENQKELNRLDAESATNQKFRQALTEADLKTRKSLIAERRDTADLDVERSGRIALLEITRQEQELQLALSQSSQVRASNQQSLVATEAQIAGLLLNQSISQTTGDELLADRLGDMERLRVLGEEQLRLAQAQNNADLVLARAAVADSKTSFEKVELEEQVLVILREQLRLKLLAGTLSQEEFDALNAGLQETKGVMQDWANSFQDISQDIAGAFENSLGGLFNDLIDGTKSAKEAFKDFARSFISQVLQMVAVKAVLAAIGGFEGGGVIKGGTSDSGTKAFAKGGVAEGGFGRFSQLPFVAAARGGTFSGPHVALIGEGKNDEAVVPLPDNRSIPVKFMGNGLGGGGGNSEIINLNIQLPVTAIDTRDFRARISEVSREIGDAVKRRLTEDPSLLQALRSGTRR